MVKLHFSIRAAIVAFLIDLIGSVLSMAWSGGLMRPAERSPLGMHIVSVFLAPYVAVQAVLEHFDILFFFNSFISILLVSCITWGCIAGLVWPLFRRRGTQTI